MTMRESNQILVVGGYGIVGRRIAAHLASWFPRRVLIGGRDAARASALALQLGNGTKPRLIDVDDPVAIESALDGVGTVMNCVPERHLHLLRAAIGRGLAYTDIAPRLAFWNRADELKEQARHTGARIVLGAGLSPGISNMMARQLAAELGRVEQIETSILLSIGDEYGPDSMNFVLESVAQPFTILREGQRRQVLPLSEGERVRFPDPLGTRMAYLFPWSDVVSYPRTLGARTSIGRFAPEPSWTGRLASILVRKGAREWLAGSHSAAGLRAALIARLRRLYAKHTNFGLVVTATGAGQTMRMTLVGSKQADATAAAAAEFTRLLVAGELAEPGAWFPEEAVPHAPFFRALELLGWSPAIERDATQADRFRQSGERLSRAPG